MRSATGGGPDGFLRRSVAKANARGREVIDRDAFPEASAQRNFRFGGCHVVAAAPSLVGSDLLRR
jgi:hypothetical protein